MEEEDGGGIDWGKGKGTGKEEGGKQWLACKISEKI